MSATPNPTPPVWIPPLLDVLVIVVFVLLGRRSHDEAERVTGFLRVGWPFAVGLGVSALAAGAWRSPFAWKRVVIAWIGTVALGMVMRIVIQGRAFKPAFVIVATVFVGAGMLGWRAIAVWRRRARGAPR